MRLAHGWGQTDVADAWNARWPDEPKSFKSISYWENWPSPTGHAPSLSVLDRLAELYECDVADLLAGWGEPRPRADQPTGTEPETLAWQVSHLDLHELIRALADWSRRLPTQQRRALLLKLSTATAVAAGRWTAPQQARLGNGPSLAELGGAWNSRYTYFSTGRNAEYEGVHKIQLRVEHDRLTGRSEPTPTGTVELDLTTDGLLVTGSWTERTAVDGYYRGAVYHGILQLMLDPTGRSMSGQWLGPDKHFVINSGSWVLTRA